MHGMHADGKVRLARQAGKGKGRATDMQTRRQQVSHIKL
jgi:hypothetical protein